MRREDVNKLFDAFLSTYDQAKSMETWEMQSGLFRRFWQEKIMNSESSLKIPDDLIPIIQILDVKGKQDKEKGKQFEGIAYTNIFQTTWYKVFDELKQNDEAKSLVNQILNSNDDGQLALLLTELFALNQQIKISSLTSKRAILINVLMFAYAPNKNISMASLADRYKFIDYFGLGNSKVLDKESYGNKIVKSRSLILGFREKHGFQIDNRGLSLFFYSEPFLNYWKMSGSEVKQDPFINLLGNKKQIILYGPPGTGKTYYTKKLCVRLLTND